MSAFTQSSMVALAPLLMTTLQCQWDLQTIHEVVVLFVLFFGNCPGDVISGVGLVVCKLNCGYSGYCGYCGYSGYSATVATNKPCSPANRPIWFLRGAWTNN